MTSIGTGPLWVTLVRAAADNLACQILEAVPGATGATVTPTVDGAALAATVDVTSGRYTAAWAASRALATLLWGGLLDEHDVRLTLDVNGLLLDVPAHIMRGLAAGTVNRRAWAAASRSRLG